MKLTDLAPLDRWIELEEDIHRRSGLDINVFDPKGYRISEFKNWANRLYPEIKATEISEDQVERLADGIPAITTEKAEILVQYIANQIKQIAAKYRKHP